MIGHTDITPENVVFRDGRAFALIDFDMARPATRADEMFNTMRVGDVIKRREAWLEQHAATLTAALTAP